VRCFNHQDQEAIGTCKGCSKGLCINCAVDLGHGLACKGVHEELVNTYNAIVSKNARVQGVQSRTTTVAPLFYAFMGLVSVGFSIFIDKKLLGFLSLMGIGFLVYAGVIYQLNRKAFSEPKNEA